MFSLVNAIEMMDVPSFRYVSLAQFVEGSDAIESTDESCVRSSELVQGRWLLEPCKCDEPNLIAMCKNMW